MKFTLFPTKAELCMAEYDGISGTEERVYQRMVDLAKSLSKQDTRIVSATAVALAQLAHEHNCTIKFIQNPVDNHCEQVVIESLNKQRLPRR